MIMILNVLTLTVLFFFRFFVAGNVYKYSVSLSCNELRCPLFLSARASGLPTHGNDTVDVNCSEVNSSKCLLNFLSPAVDQWHYLRITCLRNRSEDVTLSINAFGKILDCSNCECVHCSMHGE